QQLMVSIPNALYVGGLNANWKPILNIDEVEEYKVSIYNRLGQLVYELEDYNQFWDGSYQSTGELSSTGVFIYFMEFKTKDGNYHNRKGHITVIR
ncbi:MAG: gliding motility-associated C-terminal domain-containing protein, partial [Bacteroidota bacterium]|nr:gliding motility-associated C-terminal domain-containing protein [Bacteroidota bacterium]